MEQENILMVMKETLDALEAIEEAKLHGESLDEQASAYLNAVTEKAEKNLERSDIITYLCKESGRRRLNNAEQVIALEYLRAHYQQEEEKAQHHIDRAKVSGGQQSVDSAFYHLNAAETDVALARRLDDRAYAFTEYCTHEEALAKIDGMRKIAYIVSEFPNTFDEAMESAGKQDEGQERLKALKTTQGMCIKQENYTMAAKIRDEIKILEGRKE